MKIQMTPFYARALSLAMAACLTFALGGCATSYSISPEAQANAAAENPAPPREDEFPALNSAKWSQGSFPGIEALRAMRTGMGKDQVRELLGWPHFSEGLAGVREWNYIFHFRRGVGPDYITCQYMVRFNKDVLTIGMYWKGPDCAALLNPARVAVPAAVPSPLPAPMAKMALGADGLFRFDRSAEGDLLPEGRDRIAKLAADLRGLPFDRVLVTGHTDRLGNDAYNDALSLMRARTVRALLIQNGVDATKVRAEGRGKREPVANCAGKQAATEMVACLQPDRRVEIEVVYPR
ncbi:OmpA family protein [Variovorax sp. LT1R16]|uniref:OmpA family protein n=1 Tax=Variovorax sp. LT1R16 TaxID=3443728 RepID=UPI003F48F06B